jgi:hypothetical protein
MQRFHSIHIPHFQHFSARSVLVSARDQLHAHGIETMMTLAMLFGLFLLWIFWFVVAH